jgi:hypothetical protein
MKGRPKAALSDWQVGFSKSPIAIMLGLEWTLLPQAKILRLTSCGEQATGRQTRR